ncbi:MAG: hypothetical protein ACLQQ4_17785 [Bacteroidia bacterium]
MKRKVKTKSARKPRAKNYAKKLSVNISFKDMIKTAALGMNSPKGK